MKDIEVINLIKEFNNTTKDDLSKRFDDYNKSMSILITTETSDIKEDIKNLTKQICLQNGSIKSLTEWKIDACKDIVELNRINNERRINKRSNILFMAGQIVFIIMVALGWYFTSKKVSSTEREVKKVLVEIKK